MICMPTRWRYLGLALFLLGCAGEGSDGDSALDAAGDLAQGADLARGDRGAADGLAPDGLEGGPAADLDLSAPDLAVTTPDQKASPPDTKPLPDLPAPDTLSPTQDTDGDKLPDVFELASGLDPKSADTDGDKTPDGAEDDDKDGITAAIELAVWNSSPVEQRKASPRHRDLLVELDYQTGCAPPASVLSEAIEALDAVLLPNADGKSGIALHIYTDEKNLPVTPMSESLSDRLSYLGAHGPKAGAAGPQAAEMVHVMFVSTRPGLPSRGGDTIASSGLPPDNAGVLVYVGNLNAIFPTCTNPYPPAVSLNEALASTLVHELGHTLQLGHDTAVGGGINSYNIMSTDLGQCELLKHRTRGVGNTDVNLGATIAGGGPRFSKAAALLMKLTNKLSVEANAYEQGNGYEM
jgi:hypothetical protein